MRPKSKPLVSVILPVFNGDKFLRQAIDSVLGQTYSNLELIIVDDGSTDDTSKIIKNCNGTRIKSIQQNNAGPSAARNRGIEEAKGDFVAFIDADDAYSPFKIAEQTMFLEATDAGATYCDIQIIDYLDQEIATIKSEGIYSNKEDFYATLLFRQIIPAPATLMLKRSCFDIGLKYDESYVQSEDYKLTIDLAKNNLILYQPQVLYSYRRHMTNLSNKHSHHQNNELKILQKLGINEIYNIVNRSTFHTRKKKLLYAKILYKLGEYKQSISCLKSITPANTDSLFYIGNIQYFYGNFANAKNYFDRAITNEKQRAELFNNLGCCLAKLGKLTAAKNAFNNALMCKSNYLDPVQNLIKLEKCHDDYNLTSVELRKELLPYQTDKK